MGILPLGETLARTKRKEEFIMQREVIITGLKHSMQTQYLILGMLLSLGYD